MKLVINIPCYNEEHTLPLVLEELPTELPGIEQIEVQVVDDGSQDNTAAVAARYGCIVIRHRINRGLGAAFSTGTKAALARGADIMVNTDADNQYPSRYIAALIEPIVYGEADIVIGNRQPWQVAHFSWYKRLLQRIGNRFTAYLARAEIPDMVSGFRAYSREALLRLNVYTRFSYTLDTIVQASHKGLCMTSIVIEINPPTRPSRLFRNIAHHIFVSAWNIISVVIVYRPFPTFAILSAVIGTPAALLSLRFIYFYLSGDGSGHIQSLIFSAIGFTLAGLLLVLGVIAGLIGRNREVTEELLYLQKKAAYTTPTATSPGSNEAVETTKRPEEQTTYS